MNMNETSRFLYTIDHGSLEKWLLDQGEKSFRAKQIFEWIWKKGVVTYDQMQNLPKVLREQLEKTFVLCPLTLVRSLSSSDGQTTKFLWQLYDGQMVESVLIRAPGRATVCVSSQVGCGMGCSFCASGKKGFVRNLHAAEIVAQALAIQRQTEKITHVVFMGMGEPLVNCDNVICAIRLLCDELGISRRRITVSTVGIIKGIERLLKEGLGVQLALSLHAPRQDLRAKLLPAAQGVELAELMSAVDRFRFTTGRDVTYEYTLISGVNDGINEARELAQLLRARHGAVNLIPYNPVADFAWKRPKRGTIEKFRRVLDDHGIVNTCRYTKGDDIGAACGQLVGEA